MEVPVAVYKIVLMYYRLGILFYIKRSEASGSRFFYPFEKGDYNPTINLCIAICKALDRTLDELFWEND